MCTMTQLMHCTCRALPGCAATRAGPQHLLSLSSQSSSLPAHVLHTCRRSETSPPSWRSSCLHAFARKHRQAHQRLPVQALRDKSNELEIKMDKETNGLKAAVEQVKNESIKYCLSLMLAFSAAGLGAARLLR